MHARVRRLPLTGRSSSASKRALDLAIAVPGLLVLLPVIAWTALLMRLTNDHGPVLHRSWRVGEHGRLFKLYKLRSMRVAAEGPAITTAEDLRLTRIGPLLRRTKLDELPQLWNVVRGEMSLVGPRPEDPRYIDWQNPLHTEVFTHRPGITGPAQIHFRHEERMLTGGDAETVYRLQVLPAKVALDAAYLRSRSLVGDCRILVQTLRTVVTSTAPAFDPRAASDPMAGPAQSTSVGPPT